MATKKISELPLVNKVSGSQVDGGSVLPIVIGGGIQGTTNQISVEDFSVFVTAYSAHTGSAGNVFTGPQTINNNVTITGKLTVNELVATYETASVIYSEGGNVFGNEITDKQQLTGSVNITGSLIYNGVLTTNIDINTVSRLQQTTQSLQVATASLQFHSASVDAQLQRLQQTTQSLHVATASLQFHSASVDAQLLRLQQTTQSLQVATASLQAFSSSVNDQLQRVYQTTQSLHVATASLQFHSASVDAQLLAIQQTTQSLQIATASLNAFSASTNAHIVGISDFTSSQLAVNLGNSIYTASVDSHIVGISTYTSSVRDTLARVHQATQSLQVATASLQQFTASQDSRNFVISQFTSSTNAHIVGISTFTSSQYDTMARVYQTTSSLQSTTASLNAFTASQDGRNLTLSTVTGSLIGITNGLMAYTSSNETWKTGVRGEISAIEAWTASLDSTYATDAQLLPILQATRSLELHSGSLIGITNGLMALTASMKGQAIVSSSQQIKDYIDFVNNSVTSSMSVQSASFAAKIWTPSGTANQVLYQSAGGASSNTTTDSNFTWNAGTSTLGVKNLAIPYNGTLQSSLDATNNISLHDGVFGLIKITNGSADRITLYRNTDTIKLSGSLVIDSNNASAKHEITGSLNVNNGITGSFKGDLVGTATLATNASNIALLRDNTDTTLYPVFSAGIAGDAYSTLRGHTSGTLYYNGSTQQLIVSGGGLVVTGSSSITGSSTIIGKETITGSLLITGSITITSGSITMPHRPAFRLIGDGGQILAPYTISGSRVVMDYNQGNHYNPTTGLFRAPIAGLYQVNLVVRTATNTNNPINQAIVYKSGSNTGGDVAQIMVEFGINTSMNHTGGSTISYLDAGDTLRAVVAVGTCSFDSNDNFSVAYIG